MSAVILGWPRSTTATSIALQMLRRVTVLVVSALLARAPIHAQATSTIDGKFAPLEFLVGNCWRGTFPGSAQTDEHCFEWVFDHKFIRDRHVVRGGEPYGGETIYFWDAPASRIAFSYWNTEGQMMTGHVVSSVGDTLTFSTTVAGASGPTELRTTWLRFGSSGYRARELQRAGDSWKELFAIEMSRVK
jgi:hypothetical protein